MDILQKREARATRSEHLPFRPPQGVVMELLPALPTRDGGVAAEQSKTAPPIAHDLVRQDDERPFSPLTAWSIVCALQKYLFSYSDFQKLQAGLLVRARGVIR